MDLVNSYVAPIYPLLLLHLNLHPQHHHLHHHTAHHG